MFQAYDCLMVSERLDESNVALALLMGLDLSVVFPPTSAKMSSGNYSMIRNPQKGKLYHTCRYYVPRYQQVPVEVRTYLTSPRYLAKTYADQLIYWAANMSLDLTINQSGRERFERALNEYRAFQQEAQYRCCKQLGSGCTTNGTAVRPIEACYDNAFGCGYQCVDEIVADCERRQQSAIISLQQPAIPFNSLNAV
jgi:hypothetical protein